MQEEKVDGLLALPKRPRGHYSKKFRPIEVTTNHFKVQIQPFQKIHIFAVTYNPEIPLDNVMLRRKILEASREQLKLIIENPVISGNNIFTTHSPKLLNFELLSGNYRISFRRVKEMNLRENPKVLLNFLNNGLRTVMRRLNFMQMGRNGRYFNTSNKILIDNLMMFSGYRSNFVLLQNGYFLRVDSAKRIVRNQTVLQYIDSIYKMHEDKGREERRNVLQRELEGKIVMANYGKIAHYRIEELVFQDLDTILLEDNVNLADYYESRYSLKIKNKRQPLLKVQCNRKKNKQYQILLVPEFCLMTGIPEHFDEFRRKKISENTIKSADQKQREIMNLMKELQKNEDFGSLQQMGIRVSKDLQTIRGRIIPMPRLLLGQNNAIEQGKQASFSLYNKPIFSGKSTIKCAVLYFSGLETKPLLDIFESTSRNLKVKFEILKMNVGEFNYKKALQHLQSGVRKAAEKEGCNLCLILIPKQLRTQYKKIKNISLVKNKMVCQVATELTLRKKNFQSVATKILLQIIAKRGNILWVPKLQSNIEGVMLMAFQSAKADMTITLAMCATINSTFSQIYSTTEAYQRIEQRYNVMLNLALKGINAYAGRNKEIPAQVIIFNSSTASEQIVVFQEHYIKPLKARLQQIYKERQIALTIVLINLKVAQRFFTAGGTTVRNVPAGTLVSTEIVNDFYDFYVASQTSSKGSTLPNYYKVIHSDSNMEEEILQELVFSQCFNYVNWTGSIKAPGILQYASKCAKFSSEVLENEQLCDHIQKKLYFV